jgi:antitoxin (DNA-binding transcriptional repressor) of toxin-antitoxin stability system
MAIPKRRRSSAGRSEKRPGPPRGPRQLTGTAARRVSATEAARTFSELVNRVHYRGETVLVERGGVPVCEITPAKPPRFALSDLVGLLRGIPRPDSAYLDTVERVTRTQPVVAKGPWGR